MNDKRKQINLFIKKETEEQLNNNNSKTKNV